MSGLEKVKQTVIVPLDGMSEQESLKIAEQLKGQVWGFKVNDLLVERGVEIVSKLKAYGKVFADAKLYDIPNTVANSVARLADAGADLITIHASGGRKMIEAAVKSGGEAKILAVTLLTSFSAEEVKQVYGVEVIDGVVSLAKLAISSGAAGIVCSPNELSSLPQMTQAYLKVIPGIRPSWYGVADDQTRIATPAGAIQKGATHLVIGRPIVTHQDPKQAVQLIAQELS